MPGEINQRMRVNLKEGLPDCVKDKAFCNGQVYKYLNDNHLPKVDKMHLSDEKIRIILYPNFRIKNTNGFG